MWALLPGRIRRSLIFPLACLFACSPDRGDPIIAVDTSAYEPVVSDLFESLVREARASPHEAASRAHLGLAYEANGLVAPAAKCYEQAAALDPAEARWWYHAAITRFALGEPERAIALVDSAIARDARYAPAHWRRGNWALALGDLEEAERSYRRATELKPNHPAGWLGLARLRLRAGDPEAAEELLLAAIERRPGSPFVPYLRQLLGTAYRHQGRLEEARVELARGRAGRPRWSDRWHDAIDEYRVSLAARLQETQLLIQSGREEEALPLLEPLRAEHETSREVLTQLGVVYLNLDRLDEAREAIETCLAHHPDDAASRLNLGLVEWKSGAIARALEETRAARELNPRRASAHVQEGRLLEVTGRKSEARAAYEAAIRVDPANADALRAAATMAAVLGDAERAAELSQRAAELAPEDDSVEVARRARRGEDR